MGILKELKKMLSGGEASPNPKQDKSPEKSNSTNQKQRDSQSAQEFRHLLL